MVFLGINVHTTSPCPRQSLMFRQARPRYVCMCNQYYCVLNVTAKPMTQCSFSVAPYTHWQAPSDKADQGRSCQYQPWWTHNPLLVRISCPLYLHLAVYRLLDTTHECTCHRSPVIFSRFTRMTTRRSNIWAVDRRVPDDSKVSFTIIKCIACIYSGTRGHELVDR